MLRRLLAAAAASALLAGCVTMADPLGPPVAARGDMTPSVAPAYVDIAGASDLYEIQSSQLAMSRARSPWVRQYAGMLLSHHSGTTQQLVAAARAVGIEPMPRLLPMQRRMMAELSRTGPRNFDRVFMRQQVTAHQMALALHDNYTRRGDAPPLRQVAAAAVPIVQGHLVQARQWRGR
jgi:putative membrane protein